MVHFILSANSAFLCLMAAHFGIEPSINEPWARHQIHYMLGDTNVRGLASYSYVIGFGKNFPRRPHHRGSSCPRKPARWVFLLSRDPGM